MHSKRIKYNFNSKLFEEYDYKVFNCHITSNDNSTWSLDCCYPYVVVGGNHKCVLINNLESISEGEQEIKMNLLLTGNKHNVPGVNFSPCGELVSCNSIDTHVKIWDVYSGKLLKKIVNKTDNWYI